MIYNIKERIIKERISRLSLFFIGLAFALTLTLVSQIPASAASSFSNGFESNTDGWFPNGGTITRVSSGTNGVASADGAYHAEVSVGSDFSGVFTRWGGYENTFPTGGYETDVDIYLDMNENTSTGTDKTFDYSSAINQPNGDHRRDFIFSVGTDPTTPDQFIMSASNNAPGWPSNPGRDPFIIDQTGWYTFRHIFQDNGSGVLQVAMEVLDSDGNVLHTWILSDPTDIIGSTVGGNRYGWFVTSDFDPLAIDNSELVGSSPQSKDDCKKGSYETFGFRNQGQCIRFVNTGQDSR
jgi:hypothetical protein